MPKYIDADEYIKYCEENWIALNVDAVNKQPAADVEPVRHGRWIWHGEGYDCSECKKWVDGDIRYSFEDRTPFLPVYCPFCGTKMDKEEDDDNKNL